MTDCDRDEDGYSLEWEDEAAETTEHDEAAT
jgi:hypothetical protein